MRQILIDAPAGRVSAELARLGIAAEAHVHVVVELRDDAALPMAALAAGGGAFDWLEDEPEIYGDDDLADRAG